MADAHLIHCSYHKCLTVYYKRVMHALEAVYANAGLLVSGLALIRPQLDQGKLSLPFAVDNGNWSKNAYRARFRASALRRAKIRQFPDATIQGDREFRERCDLG